MRIWVADSAAVSGSKVRNTFDGGVKSTDFAQFELPFSCSYTVSGETAFSVIKQAESFVGSLNGDNI